MTTLIPFEFENNPIRIIDKDGEPWFVAKDVALALDYTDADQAIRKHCKRAITYPVDSTGQVRHVKIIPEGDVYRLIVKSNKENAIQFEEKVFEEVLPSIRKTGGYGMIDLSDPELLRRTLLGYTEKVIELEKQVEEQAPKVAFAEQVEVKPDAISVAKAAKTIGTGQKRLFALMRQEGWVTRKNEPYQSKINSGLLDVKLSSWDHPDQGLQSCVTTLVTGKGLVKLQELHSRHSGA